MSRANRVAGLIVALSLAVAACSTGNEEDSATDRAGGSDRKCVIGMTQINQTAAFFAQMNEGARSAAEQAGCELQIANANNDSAKQSSDIENFVTQQVTGLIVVAIDVNGVLPAVAQAKAQGIRVVAVDAKLEDGAADTFVGVDNEAAGEQAARWAIDAGFGAGAYYGVVNARGSLIQNQREDSFRAAIDAAGAKFTQAVNGDNVQEKAATAARNLVSAQHDLNFVYTTGEPATVGAVAALDAVGPTKVIGWDLTAEVIGGIDEGLVAAVIAQDPREEGVRAVKELKAIIGGAEPAGFIDVPITIVTEANVDPYREIYK